MNTILNYLSTNITGSQSDSGLTSTIPERIANIGSTRIALGNMASMRVRDVMPRNSDMTSVLDLCVESNKIYRSSPAPLEKAAPEKLDLNKEKEIFTQRFFAYYMAQILSGSRFSSEEYVKFANQASKDHTKDVWEMFRDSDLWKELTITEKVKATAAHYLFGEIARNFLEDFLQNFMNFFMEKYSSKKGLESLSINILEKMHRFLANFESAVEDYGIVNPGNSSFKKYLERDLKEGRLIKSLTHSRPGKPLYEQDLFIRLGNAFLKQFLPKLRIKEAILNKLVWNFEGNLEKGVLAIPYVIFATLHIPFLILAYAFEGIINDLIKKTLQEKLPYLSDLASKEIEKAWTESVKEGIITSIYTQVENFRKNEPKPANKQEPVSDDPLHPEVQKRIKALVPLFFKSALLCSKGEDREEVKRAMDSQSQTLMERQVHSALESLTQGVLSSLFSGLIKDNLMENIFHTLFESLTGSLTTEQKPSAPIKRTQQELLAKIEETVRENIEDMIGSEESIGIPEIDRFFDRYKAKFTPYLQKMTDILQNHQNTNKLKSTLALLDQHRNELNQEMRKFKELFEVRHPIAFREVNEKLLPIARAQNKALQELVNALKAQENLDKEIQQKIRLEELLKAIESPEKVQQLLLESSPFFESDFLDSLLELNEKRKDLQSKTQKDKTDSSEIKAYKDNIRRTTFAIKLECNSFIDLLNIDLFEDEVTTYTHSFVQTLHEMKVKTLSLKADPTIMIRPTQAASAAISAAVGSILPISAPAIALGSAIVGRVDPIYEIKNPVFDRIYPKVQEVISSSIDFLLHDAVFPRAVQTLTVIAKDEFPKGKKI